MKPKSELMARLRARRQREGMVRLEFWIPADKVEQVRDYVKKLQLREFMKRAADSAALVQKGKK